MVRTVVIVDWAHSGTTMTAGVFHILVVPMIFSKYNWKKIEDERINEAHCDEHKFAELVKQRNKDNPVWGFKRCGGWQNADMYNKYLRNPVYFAIYKDPVSTTMARYMRLDFRRLIGTIDSMRESAVGMRRCGLNINLLSYQTAIVDPDTFVQNLIDLTGIEPTERQIRKAIAYIQPTNGLNPRIEYPSVEEWA